MFLKKNYNERKEVKLHCASQILLSIIQITSPYQMLLNYIIRYSNVFIWSIHKITCFVCFDGRPHGHFKSLLCSITASHVHWFLSVKMTFKYSIVCLRLAISGKEKKKRTHIERPTAHVRRTTPTTQLDEIKLDSDAYLGALHSGLNLNLIINFEVYLLDHKTVKKRQVVLCVCVSCVCFFVYCVQRRLCSKNHSNRQTWASMGRLLPISFAYKLWEFIKSGS